MERYVDSCRSVLAYAISRKAWLAEMCLVVGCAIVATFAVAFSMTATFGYDSSISWVVSFMSCLVVGIVLSALYLMDCTRTQVQ